MVEAFKGIRSEVAADPEPGSHALVGTGAVELPAGFFKTGSGPGRIIPGTPHALLRRNRHHAGVQSLRAKRRPGGKNHQRGAKPGNQDGPW